MRSLVTRNSKVLRPDADLTVPAMRRVIVESPFAAMTSEEKMVNLDFAADCCRDCVSRGENPFASHLFYTQFLDDNNPVERKLALEMAFEMWDFYDAIVFYMDRGLSPGMQLALIHAFQSNKPFERRILHKMIPAPTPQKTIAEGLPETPDEVLKYAPKADREAHAQDSDTRTDGRDPGQNESGGT